MFGPWERTEDEIKVSRALEKVAGEFGITNIRAGQWLAFHTEGIIDYAFVVALAYVMQKTPYVFPIVGGRKVEHLLSNIETLDISLSSEQFAYLESVLPFDVGFPNNLGVSLASLIH